MLNIQKFNKNKIAYVLLNYIILCGIINKRLTMEESRNQPYILQISEENNPLFFEIDTTRTPIHESSSFLEPHNRRHRDNRNRRNHRQDYIEYLNWRQILCGILCHQWYQCIISTTTICGILYISYSATLWMILYG
jgi:hypothetical protein